MSDTQMSEELSSDSQQQAEESDREQARQRAGLGGGEFGNPDMSVTTVGKIVKTEDVTGSDPTPLREALAATEARRAEGTSLVEKREVDPMEALSEREEPVKGDSGNPERPREMQFDERFASKK